MTGSRLGGRRLPRRT